MRFALLLFTFWSREGFGKELADESEGDYKIERILSNKVEFKSVSELIRPPRLFYLY